MASDSGCTSLLDMGCDAGMHSAIAATLGFKTLLLVEPSMKSRLKCWRLFDTIEFTPLNLEFDVIDGLTTPRTFHSSRRKRYDVVLGISVIHAMICSCETGTVNTLKDAVDLLCGAANKFVILEAVHRFVSVEGLMGEMMRHCDTVEIVGIFKEKTLLKGSITQPLTRMKTPSILR